jgi:hypothetical protein
MNNREPLVKNFGNSHTSLARPTNKNLHVLVPRVPKLVRPSSREPRNRTRVDVIAARDVGERFAQVAAANRLAPLMRGELEGSAQALPVRLGTRPALARAGADQLALKLCQPAQHGQH